MLHMLKRLRHVNYTSLIQDLEAKVCALLAVLIALRLNPVPLHYAPATVEVPAGGLTRGLAQRTEVFDLVWKLASNKLFLCSG